MKQETPVLKATKRDRLGSRYARRLRAAGRLPAIVYGHKQDPVGIALDAREALGLLHKGEKVFRLSLDGEGGGDGAQVVLIKGVQFDYLGTEVVHVDFARVDLNERVRTRVPIHLIGEAPGLKHAGAIMMRPNTELEIECTVLELPDYIEVSVDTLDLDHALTAGDVPLPSPTMRLITDKHVIVSQIVVQVEAPVAAEAATVEAAAAGQPEVITAKKEEAAGAAAEKGGGKKEEKKK